MKQLTLLFATLAFSLSLGAQTSNLVIYSEMGEPFLLSVNGMQQNEEPTNRVVVTDLNQTFYKVLVRFADPSKGIINKSFQMTPGKETVAVVKMNNKGRYVLRWQSEAPIQAPAAPDAPLAVTSPTEPEPATETAQPEPVQPVKTTTEVQTAPAQRESMKVTLTMEMPTQMEITQEMTIEEYEESVTTTTTQESETVEATETPALPDPLPGYTGRTGCDYPVLKNEFDGIQNAIRGQSFEDTKMKTAQQIVKSRCLLASQVRDIMKLFDFEDTRLDFAKFAYDHTYDLDNYYQVNEAFEFELTTEELIEYIQSR